MDIRYNDGNVIVSDCWGRKCHNDNFTITALPVSEKILIFI